MRLVKILIPAIICIVLLTACQGDTDGNGELNIETARIGVVTGSRGERYALEELPDATIRGFGNFMDAVTALQTGWVDAVITADIICRYVARENPNLERRPELLAYEYVCVGINKGDEELLADINGIIATLGYDGTLDDMRIRWMYTFPPVPADIPEITAGEVLRVGTSAVNMPFIYRNAEGETVGYAAEFARLLGQKLGRRIEFITMDFGALISSLESHRVDVIIDIMAASDERSEIINFSEPFYSSGQNILVRKAATDGVASDDFWLRIKTGFERNLLHENRWITIFEGLKVSLSITFFAFILATLLGTVICSLRLSKNRLLKTLGSSYVTIVRGLPIVVILLIVFYLIFARSSMSGIVVAIIAYGLNGAAFVGEIMRNAISSVNKDQIEAARSMGFSKTGAFLAITVPQAVRTAFPAYLTEFGNTFKLTAVIGYVAIIDLTKAGDIIRSRTYDAFFPILTVAVVYLLMAALIVCLINFINKRLNKRTSAGRGN